MSPELVEVVRKLRNIELQQRAYVDKVPLDIQDFVFDNEYANLQGLKFDAVVQALFADNVEDVYWFLYEFNPAMPGPHLVNEEGKEYTFKTDEDYYQRLLEN